MSRNMCSLLFYKLYETISNTKINTNKKAYIYIDVNIEFNILRK